MMKIPLPSLIALVALCSVACGPLSAPTPTSVPPTATAIPPTATSVPQTATAIPPTATAISPTATSVPPTSAPTVMPSATATRVPPTIAPSPTPPVLVRQPFDGGGIPNAIFVFLRTTPGPTTVLMFQVLASEDNPSNSDGKGIKNVEFRFLQRATNGAETEVYKTTESAVPYCAFQDANNVCNRWVIAQRNNRWPNNTPIRSGDYVLRVKVLGNNGSERTDRLDFSIQLP